MGCRYGGGGWCRVVLGGVSAILEGWAMHEPSDPMGDLSLVVMAACRSSVAWPLGTLTSPISQAASLPIYYLRVPQCWCLIRA